ncbi:rhomboid family intramembrane serine protease [Solitalea sp. MAHUQ-68]|uniref:Rhomboid family intramembrane serine protease n=1 Tax=Solitalea agri TaxID=2953739 RepID=A0A9X2F1I2_9SPHI|nr:rhomboid family intramembrane serine protease [Solitalea agri]MCO4292370.1 rhomboid family intramembrane serine protease [Solitalea agri]
MESSQTGSITKSFIISFYIVVVLWIIKWVEFKFELSFAPYGIIPRKVEGLIGIFAAPFIHSDIPHLVSNTFPILITGTMMWYFFKDLATKVVLGVYLLSGIGVWLFARPAIHIGASGVVYGLTSFLFFSGLFRRDPRLLGLSFLVVFLYGSLFWGLFPFVPEVSWESHVAGGLAGVLFAFLYKNKGPQRKIYAVEIEDEDELENEEDRYWEIKDKPDEEQAQ